MIYYDPNRRVDKIENLNDEYIQRYWAKKPRHNKELVKAIETNDLQQTCFLLKLGADPNTWDPHGYAGDGCAVLNLACLRGHSEIVAELIKFGASIDSKFKKYQSRLIDKPPLLAMSPLYCAVLNNHISTAVIILENNADPNASTVWTNYRQIPVEQSIHAAVKNNSVEMVELLINWDADVNAKTRKRVTALQIAVQRGSMKISQLLISHDADINAVCSKGMSALHYAMKGGHRELVCFLIEEGAKTDIRDMEGRCFNDIAFTWFSRGSSLFFSGHSKFCRLIDHQNPRQILAKEESQAIQAVAIKDPKTSNYRNIPADIANLIISFKFGVFTKSQLDDSQACKIDSDEIKGALTAS